MSGFDQEQVYVSRGLGPQGFEEEEQDPAAVAKNSQLAKKQFKEFLRGFSEGDFNFKYRDILRRNYNVGQYWLEVDVSDLASFDEELADVLIKRPTDYLALFEEAAKELADEITSPRPKEEEEIQDIQIMLSSEANPIPLRELKSVNISRIIKVSGIVLSTSGVRSKAGTISLMCRSCKQVLPNINVQAGFEGYSLPRKCASTQGTQVGDAKCPLDPYFIMPDRCKSYDFQVLKLQESPESVPSGEMPRHMKLHVDRFLCEKAVPGNRVTVTGIYCVKRTSQYSEKNRGGSKEKQNAGVLIPYVRVLGIQLEMDGSGRSTHVSYTPQEEEEFRKLADNPECHDIIARSIAPSIFGSHDIKKAIACLLFGGSRKIMPDGLTRRGDINVLLLGDPGTAKSQLLKFVEKVSPIGIYTSGKGSSAAGLTASVNRDPATKNFIMEGGAMVLADGGVVCIDEFDKMREDDRVAIHEAMEQQTISIAKAGITTTLNSRCAVLAAANSIFGRWDDTKGDENIDFMPTILSRFDTIFIVKDEHSEARDTTMAKHVMKIHMDSQRSKDAAEVEGELSLLFLKKYIAYCKARCGPRLTAEAADKLKNRYVLMRSGNHAQEMESHKRNPIPITVRQLEAIVRIAESLAKMQLKPFANEAHVDEALRLFQVSTLEAAHGGNLAGVEGFTSDKDTELLNRIEHQLKRRFAIGSQVSEHTIIQDFTRQKYPEPQVQKVIQTMIRRGELQHRLQRKMLYRLK